MKEIRPIAIYLPQYHPIPENDEWWGKGFTEWRNVVKGSPRFNGHYQPHLPSDLGYYDLRLPEVREQQAAMASEYGIYGFCYYHYWFTGRRILERPFQEVFESGKPDFPFMLCWANENWTRAWSGSEKNVLLEQKYSDEDDRNHIQYLLPYFKDDRYIKVDGKPLFNFYRTDLLPNINRTTEIFREEAKKEGLELYLCQFERWIDTDFRMPEEKGLDAAVDFQPLSRNMMKFREQIENSPAWKLNNFSKKATVRLLPNTSNSKLNTIIYDYEKFVDFDLKQPLPHYKKFPGICPSWDNSSRRKDQKSVVFANSTPKKFGQWYKGKVDQFSPYSEDENFLFINAWNEWAEGNHLEPCEKWGTQYLDEIKNCRF